jgi:putative zinc finger protein
MTCPHTDAIGVYVLGALHADERIELERHIRDCPSCREAVQQFAHVPGVLHSLTLEDVLALRLDDEADSQPAAIRRRRTPKRALLATAAAVGLLVSGGLIGRQIPDGPASPPQAGSGISWSATDGVGGIDARVQLSGRSWGTDIQVHLDDLAPGRRCMLVVHTRNGQSEVTGWWTTTTIPEADVPASSSFALSDIARVDVVTADNAVLASLTASTR